LPRNRFKSIMLNVPANSDARALEIALKDSEIAGSAHDLGREKAQACAGPLVQAGALGDEHFAEADVLEGIAGSGESFDPVFKAIARAAMRLMPTAHVALLLTRNGQPALRLERHLGSAPSATV
jgi:hypothetical protein